MLPAVRVRRVDDSLVTGVADRHAEAYGFNSGLPWDRPEAYIRWLATDASADPLEYDMDEQDKLWLDTLNSDRRRDGSDPVSYEFFEILVDRLENEWFALARRIPRPPAHLPPEDGRCAVCDDGECENANAIVFCDGCNLAVHQDCYGIPYIPEGQWLCRKCTVSPDKPVTCILCSNEFGAFKQTYSGQWAHLLCAIWVPETGVSNTDYMEPVDGIEAIPKSRWKLLCYLCKKRTGACIQCSNKNCFTAFHATCARDYGLHLSLRPQNAHYDGPSDNKAYCHRHMPRPDGLPHDHDPSPPKWPIKRRNTSSKASRAYLKSYTTGPPIVPQYIYDRISTYTDRIKIRKKAQVIDAICKYWSLKREMRRSAPLLKRLHLEPWTATHAAGHQSDSDKARMLQLIVRLRQDLEKVRMLADCVRKREKEKLRRAQLLQSVLEPLLFPLDHVYHSTIDRIAALDRNSLFLDPVSLIDVPDYTTVIKHPMDWSTISSKIDRHQYLDPSHFRDDVLLVLSNAKLYNTPDTTFYKTASKLQSLVHPILNELEVFNTEQWENTILHHVSSVDSNVIAELFKYDYDNDPQEQQKQKQELPQQQQQQQQQSPSLTNLPPIITRRTRQSIAASLSENPSIDHDETIKSTPVTSSNKKKRKAPSTTPVPSEPVKETPPPPQTPVQQTPPQPVSQPSTQTSKIRFADLSREEQLRIKRERERERRALRKAVQLKKNGSKQHHLNKIDEILPPQNQSPLSPSPSPSSPQPQIQTQRNTANEDTSIMQQPQTRTQTQTQMQTQTQTQTQTSPAETSSTTVDPSVYVQSVENIDLFKKFDSGWILPQGMRRKRPQHNYSLPPSKRARKSLSNSTSSAATTTKEHDPDVSNADDIHAPLERDNKSVAEEQATAAPHAKMVPRRRRRKSVQEPTGSALQSELSELTDLSDLSAAGDEDTGAAPAPAGEAKQGGEGEKAKGKAKAKAKDEGKSETGNAGEVADANGEADADAEGEVDESFMRAIDKKVAAESESDTVASPVVDKKDVRDNAAAQNSHRKRATSTGAPSPHKKVTQREWDHKLNTLKAENIVTSETELPDRTLVWAKMPGFPEFPAEISDENDPIVPPDVLSAKKPEQPHLVMFFDKPQRSWQWVASSKLWMLGVSSELDDMLVSQRHLGRKKNSVLSAYKIALETVQGDEK